MRNQVKKLRFPPNIHQLHLEYQNKIKQLRKSWFVELRHEKIQKEKPDENDPMIVGTYKPRRELKREMLKNFGKMDPIVPVENTQRKRPTSQMERDEMLKRVFIRDLNVNNPKLVHLMHLWNETEKFVTKTNLDDKITDFFTKKEEWQPLTATDRVKNVVEYGIPQYDEMPDQSMKLFGTIDKEIVRQPRKELIEGNLGKHALIREICMRDAKHGSLMGKIGVLHVLQLSIND